MNGNPPKVYTIVLNWNNFADSKACIESLETVTYPNLDIIVVDNGSIDHSGARLQQHFPHLQFVFNDKNLGFARGCNVGIREALKDSACQYVLLLNNDATTTPGFLEQAVTFAEADSQIGLVGGKILYSAQSRKIWYAGGEVLRWRGGVQIRGFREIDNGQYDEVGEMGFISGALMLIKREVLERVGLLPEEYFFGIEEIDYSLAVKRAGYKLIYVPEFLVYHAADGSHSNYNPKFVYNNYRSKLILQEKYLSKPVFFIWKWVFKLYGKFLVKRIWQRLRNEDADLQDKRVPFEEMRFAFMKAFEDHRKNILSEETLAEFEAELNQRRPQATG